MNVIKIKFIMNYEAASEKKIFKKIILVEQMV